MKEIHLSVNKNIASIGPGNTWFDVYSALEPEGLTVVGGRVAAIGVGGLTLGGKGPKSGLRTLTELSNRWNIILLRELRLGLR
jgi:hypothetical protein